MTGKILRFIRVVLSVIVLGVLLCGLTCAALQLPVIGPLLEHVQIGAAVISFSITIFIGWLLLTLVFGRVYCSTVCPLGTLQDVFARLPRMRPLSRYGLYRNRYRYSAPSAGMRLAFLSVTLVCLMLGSMALPSVVEPYSVFVRIVNGVVKPLLASVAGSVGMDGTGPVAVMVTASLAATLIASVLLVCVALFAMRGGRTLCSTVCPVGTALGCVSRFSVFQMDIDTDRCVNCGKCRDVCKAHCIDLDDHVVDGSRCVVCFDCVAVCRDNAIRYTCGRHRLSTPVMQRLSRPGREAATSLNCTDRFAGRDEKKR